MLKAESFREYTGPMAVTLVGGVSIDVQTDGCNVVGNAVNKRIASAVFINDQGGGGGVRRQGGVLA